MYSLVEANCPVCGKFDTDIKFSFTKHRLNIVKCRNCQMVWTTPQVRKRDLDNLYEPNYYDSVMNQLKENSSSTFRKLINKKKRQQLLHSFARRFNVLMKAIPTPDARLLEIGCGNGNFLLYLRDHDCQATGIDTSPHAVTLATKQGLQIFQGELDKLNLTSNKFDGILMYHVLEHVYSPKGLLKEIHRLLKPSGILIIEVPNIDSFSARLFGPHWMHLALPLHVNHFSPTTLSLMLKQAHFTIKGAIHSSRNASTVWKLGFKAVVRVLLRWELKPSIFEYIDESERDRRDLKIPLRTDIIDLFLDPIFILIPLLEKLMSSGSDFTIIASKKCSANGNPENSNGNEPSM